MYDESKIENNANEILTQVRTKHSTLQISLRLFVFVYVLLSLQREYEVSHISNITIFFTKLGTRRPFLAFCSVSTCAL